MRPIYTAHSAAISVSQAEGTRVTYGQKVGTLLALVADLLFRREPQELGHLLVVLDILVKVTDDAHPGLIALCLQQHRIADFASEPAHTRADDVPARGSRRRLSLPRSRILPRRVVGVVVDPLPWMVFVAKLIVRVFAEYGAAREKLARLLCTRAFDGRHGWWRW
jgi:hypothetical protein